MKRKYKNHKIEESMLFYVLNGLLFMIPLLAPPQAWANSPQEVRATKYEPVKAYVIDNNPENFTIDVYSLANIMVDQEAPAFAVYLTTSPPKSCADFTSANLSYTKPEKYQRQFDLTQHEDIQNAIEKYRCIVIRNIPQE